jgi:hypothetical protein
MTIIEREAELDRRLENLKIALREYVDFLESSKKDEAPAPRKRKPCKGPDNNVFVYG